jgi:hypothetical protein
VKEPLNVPPLNVFALIVPAEKFPAASRATMPPFTFDEVAVVALLATLPLVTI